MGDPRINGDVPASGKCHERIVKVERDPSSPVLFGSPHDPASTKLHHGHPPKSLNAQPVGLPRLELEAPKL